MARPKLTCSGVTRCGLPSISAKWLFISGKSTSAFTTAYPMTWVKLILPPRERLRWLLITTRLSASSLAGTARTLVAVGTVSEVCMLATTRAEAPRSVIDVSPPASWTPGVLCGLGAAAFAGSGGGAAGADAAGAGAADVGDGAAVGVVGAGAAWAEGAALAGVGAGSAARGGVVGAEPFAAAGFA